MKKFFAEMFSADFMPHGHCYYWAPEILWSHAISNSIIAMAYCAIPVSLIYIFKKRDDFKFIWMMVLFAIFILGCGITHIMDVIVIWEPIYRLDAFFRIITALASIGTAIVLVKITPDILQIPTTKEWEVVNKALKDKQSELEETIEMLSAKQKELEFSNALLITHREELQAINEELSSSQEELQVSNERLVSSRDELEIKNIELQEAEKSLTFLNNELEARVVARTSELEERNEELVKTNIDLDNFIYTASHDLKSPITNLEGLVSLLKLHLKENDNEIVEKVLNMTGEAVNKMKETIEGLSDIIKVHRDKGDHIEVVNFKDIVENVKFDLKDNIKISNAQIDEDLKVESIAINKNSLRSIFHNLLSNAIKYRSPEKDLKIKISTSYEDSFVVITVSDNGLGIPKKHQPKLFTMFKRFHTHVEGTGIGLYIIKRIVENNRGKLILESEQDQGTTFKIYIPT